MLGGGCKGVGALAIEGAWRGDDFSAGRVDSRFLPRFGCRLVFLGAAFLRGEAVLAGREFSTPAIAATVGFSASVLGNSGSVLVTSLVTFLEVLRLGFWIVVSAVVLEAVARFTGGFFAGAFISAKGSVGTALAVVAIFFGLGGLTSTDATACFLGAAAFLRGVLGASKETSVFAVEVLEERLGFGDEEGAGGTQRGIHS